MEGGASLSREARDLLPILREVRVHELQRYRRAEQQVVGGEDAASDPRPQAPCGASGWPPVAAQRPGPLAVRDRAACAPRQTDSAEATRRSAASVPATSLRPASAGRRRSIGPVSATGMVAVQAVDGCGRSWRCAPQARLGERPGSTIMLQGQLANLGVEGLEIRRVRCRLGPAKDICSPRL